MEVILKLKGSYTVEAAWIISFCMIIVGASIMLAFDIYYEAFSYAAQTIPEDIDIVERFKIYSLGAELFTK